jgi:hypothetical protein
MRKSPLIAGHETSVLPEVDYQRAFYDMVSKAEAPLPWLDGSIFFREVPLRYDIGKAKPSKDRFMPDTIADFIELDAQGRFHLWEAKRLWSDEFQKGKVVGQLIFYDFLFHTDQKRTWLRLKPLADAPASVKRRLRAAEPKFQSWNVLICGGCGWELAAGVNPHAWTYISLNETYFKKDAVPIAVYHLFHTSTGFAVRNLWQLSLNDRTDMHPDSLKAFVEEGEDFSGYNRKKSKDKMPKELMLKFIGRSTLL